MSGLATERSRRETKLTSPTGGGSSQPTVGDLFQGVGTDFSTLLRLEARLARVETREKLERTFRSVSWISGGGFLLYSAVLVLMISAAAGYALFLPSWLAVLLIALFTLVLGGMLIQVGRKRLKQRSLYPRQTVRSLRRDVAIFQQHFGMPAQPPLATAPSGGQRDQRLLLAAELESEKKETSMWQMLKETVNGWIEDNASQLAAALSFYTAVSIAPLLVLIVAVVGLVLGEQQAAESQLLGQLRNTVGAEGSQFLEMALESAQQPTVASLAGILSFIALLWGSTNVFAQLQSSLNAIWNVEPKPGRGIWGAIRDRFLSFAMVLGVAFLLLVSLVLSSVLSVVIAAGQTWLPGFDWVWQVVNYVVSFVVVTSIFAAIYKVLPDVEIAWRHVWLGAAVTAALFMIGQFALNLYLANAGTTYGAVGSVVVFLLWVYYSAQILFFGAEFTQVYARHHGAGIQPAANAIRPEEVPAPG